jgi:hypothetical protein
MAICHKKFLLNGLRIPFCTRVFVGNYKFPLNATSGIAYIVDIC